MAISIISAREQITVTEVSLAFSYPGEIDHCALFDVIGEEQGKELGIDPMTPSLDNTDAANNYHRLIDMGLAGQRVEYEHHYTQAAIGRCECGGEVEMWSAHYNGCDGCDREYNIVGQELRRHVDMVTEYGSDYMDRDDM